MAIVRQCEVISITDPTNCDRIKVKMSPEDNSKSLSEIPYVFPMLPKMLHVKPKVGESVFVITAVADNGDSLRYYFGPIITQQTHMEEEPSSMSENIFNGSYGDVDRNPNTNTLTKGAFPDDDDISIEGRRNCGIQIKNDDIRIKAGVKISNPMNRHDVVFNTKNPAYLKLKYHEDKNDDTYKSTATIVADKINLIGNTSETVNFQTTDSKDLITDKTMEEIIEKAHQLPYGDILIEFLSLFREAFLKHTHNFPSFPTCPADDVVNLANYKLNDILSKNIRIN